MPLPVPTSRLTPGISDAEIVFPVQRSAVVKMTSVASCAWAVTESDMDDQHGELQKSIYKIKLMGLWHKLAKYRRCLHPQPRLHNPSLPTVKMLECMCQIVNAVV